MERLEITQGIDPGEAARERVLRAIEDRGYSWNALAGELGMKLPQLSAILNGNKKARVETWKRICEPLGLRVFSRLEVEIHY